MLTKRKHHGWMWLFRFSEKRFLEEFRRHGLLYMRPSSYFADLERHSLTANTARPDRFEGTYLIHHPKHIQSLVIEGPGGFDSRGRVTNIKINVPPGDLADHLAISIDRHASNIFCMYAVITPGPVDERNFQFGDSFIFVHNTTEFLKRFGSSANKQNLRFGCGLVNYFELSDYSGRTGPLRKPSAFAYQNEFRLIVRPCAYDHRKLFLENLEDITSEILPLPQINHLCDLSPDAARKAGLSW
jgi:hypothetical protein